MPSLLSDSDAQMNSPGEESLRLSTPLFPGEVFDRSLAGNQGVGMFLCELASEMLGRTIE